MNGTNVQLFGLAVLLVSGFVVVGYTTGFPFQTSFAWGLWIGLGITFLGMLYGDGTDGRTDSERT